MVPTSNRIQSTIVVHSRHQYLPEKDSRPGQLPQSRSESLVPSMSSLPGMTLQHQPHQLLASPRTSLCSGALPPDSYSGTQAPTRTMRTNLRLTTPPMPSISWRWYPERSWGEGVRSSARMTSARGPPWLGYCSSGGVVVDGEAERTSDHDEALLPLASSASQSISCSRSLAAQQWSSRPQMTPRSPSPIPVPRPPRTSP